MLLQFNVESDEVRGVLETISNDSIKWQMLSAMADSFVSETKSFIEAGNSFHERTGFLKKSISYKFVTNDDVEVFAGANYASFVEYGHKIMRHKEQVGVANPYPFLFADHENRNEKMLLAARSVLNEVLNGDY